MGSARARNGQIVPASSGLQDLQRIPSKIVAGLREIAFFDVFVIRDAFERGRPGHSAIGRRSGEDGEIHGRACGDRSDLGDAPVDILVIEPNLL